MSRIGRGSSADGKRYGAAAVEFAAIGIVVFMVLFGIIEFGRAWMVQHILNEVARRACRQAVCLQSAQVPVAYASDWNTYITANIVTPELTKYGLTSATTTYYVNNASADVSTASGFTPGATAYTSGSEVKVEVSVAWSDVTWSGRFIPASATIVGMYTLRKD